MMQQSQKTYDIEQNSYIWNTLAGLINAGQSVLLMLVITRACGIEEAGVFSISFAYANLLLCIGKYGMRKFQVTDTGEEYLFFEYFLSRVITSVLMLAGSGIILIYGNIVMDYSVSKTIIILLVCVWKMLDALDDVFLGMFHQKKRLDIGARNSFIRNSGTVFIISLLIILTKNLCLSISCGIVISAGILVINNIRSYHIVNNASWKLAKMSKVVQLLAANLPLCIGGFLSYYIINFPKYTIDKYYTSAEQGVYGIISLPVLVIALLSDFIFMPMLVNYTEKWKQKDIAGFLKLLTRQVLYVISISILIIILGYWIGIPIMEWIYGINIKSYAKEFCVLLIGGCFTAVSSLMDTLVTTIRCQKAIVPIYIIAIIIAWILRELLKHQRGLLGAIIPYLVSTVVLVIMLFSVILYKVRKTRSV